MTTARGSQQGDARTPDSPAGWASGSRWLGPGWGRPARTDLLTTMLVPPSAVGARRQLCQDRSPAPGAGTSPRNFVPNPRLQKVIHRNDGAEGPCTERDGWCLPKTSDDLRDAMSLMIRQTIRAKRPGESRAGEGSLPPGPLGSERGLRDPPPGGAPSWAPLARTGEREAFWARTRPWGSGQGWDRAAASCSDLTLHPPATCGRAAPVPPGGQGRGSQAPITLHRLPLPRTNSPHKRGEEGE